MNDRELHMIVGQLQAGLGALRDQINDIDDHAKESRRVMYEKLNENTKAVVKLTEQVSHVSSQVNKMAPQVEKIEGLSRQMKEISPQLERYKKMESKAEGVAWALGLSVSGLGLALGGWVAAYWDKIVKLFQSL